MTWRAGRFLGVISIVETSGLVVQMSTKGGLAYVKVLGNPEGPHMLACEHIGTACAHFLGLPTFERDTMDLSSQDAASIVLRDPDATRGELRAQAGPAFATKAEVGNPWDGEAESLGGLANRQTVAGLIVLDTWIRNRDRHPPDGVKPNFRNVFLAARTKRRGDLTVVAYDHGHSIRCDESELTKRIGFDERVKDERLYGAFPAFVQVAPPNLVEPYATRLGQFSATDARAIIAGVPPEWRVDQGTRDAIERFLVRRADFLSTRIADMYEQVYRTKWQLTPAKDRAT